MQLWLCCFEHSVHRESRSLSFGHLYSSVTHAPVYLFVLFVHRIFCMGLFFYLWTSAVLSSDIDGRRFWHGGDCLADGSQRKPCFRVTVETTGCYFFRASTKPTWNLKSCSTVKKGVPFRVHLEKLAEGRANIEHLWSSAGLCCHGLSSDSSDECHGGTC